MEQEQVTTIRISKQTKKRFRGYAKHVRATDEETLTWILNQLEDKQ